MFSTGKISSTNTLLAYEITAVSAMIHSNCLPKWIDSQGWCSKAQRESMYTLRWECSTFRAERYLVTSMTFGYFSSSLFRSISLSESIFVEAMRFANAGDISHSHEKPNIINYEIYTLLPTYLQYKVNFSEKIP